jgi:pimeloyl-ACP methyl ester carboxylesterase
MRVLAVVSGVLLAALVLALVVLGFTASYSPSGWLMLVGLAMVAAGAIATPWRRSRRRVVVRAGTVLFAAVTFGRVVLVGTGDAKMVTLPGGFGSRWLGRVVDEKDGALVGVRLIAVAWRLPQAERSQLVPAMQEAYAAMGASEGLTPSPVLDTLVGRQGPNAFDALVVEPRGRPALAALVFLHGFGGSYTLECWMMAEAARAIGAVTVCPSTGIAGQWWAPEGERTLRATLAYLEARGIRRVYLAGLSNGGVGATLLAPRFAGSLAGLILVSGVPSEGSTAGLPALVVHGESDAVMSAQVAHAFAARTGATYAGFDGGHFVMMVRRAEVRDAISRWLRERAGQP